MIFYWIVVTILAVINSQSIFDTSDGNFIAVVGPNKLNYSQAQEYCNTNYGTSLARVTSQVQNDELFNIGLHLWIDGNDLQQEGEWTFSNGELFWSSQSGLVQGFYENWGPTEPNNSAGREHCLMLAGNDADWIDQLCEVELDFACDKVSYVSEVEILTCPEGSVQVGAVNSDIYGCGITSCEDRYNYEDIEDCENGCRTNPNCQAFTWAPLGGDQNHVNEKVCTFYSSDIPTGTWRPNQIFCRLESLKCPAGSVQVGAVNADIYGCGITSCEDRYNYQDIEDCENGCRSNLNCQAFTWAPLGGDQNHVNEKVCTFYSSEAPTGTWGPHQIFCRSVKCPAGSVQVGGVNADIAGCGLTSCDERYSYQDIEECEDVCRSNSNCKAFTWAPLGGDQNHVNEKVCTFYNSNTPNRQWAPNQIMCRSVKCPPGSTQVGVVNSDIAGCGLQECSQRYTSQNIVACRNNCLADTRCKAFTWAPLSGDQNHVNERVCTLYDSDTPNRLWEPNQIMCKK